MTTILTTANTLTGATTTPVASNEIALTRLGSFAGTGTTANGRAESIAFENGRLFTTNAAARTIDVTQILPDGTTAAVTSINIGTLPQFGSLNSVAVKNGLLAVAYDNATAGLPGFVAIYRVGFQVSTNPPIGQTVFVSTLVTTVTVGVLPDHVTFTPDGSRIIVANEAEAISSTSNAAGTISIIDVAGVATNPVVQTIVFTGLNPQVDALRAAGFALFPGELVSADIEPEYISVSPDGTRAYVTLQEVSGVAVIDLTNPAATAPLSVVALGGVDHSLPGNRFDPSDRNGIALVNAPVTGLLQPDAIASYTVGGITYFVTANEGDARVGLTDSVRLGSTSYTLDPATFPNAAALKADTALGRLNVFTNIGDTDGDGDFDRIFSLGGRGITIFRQNADGTITKVRETGGEFEAIIARDFPTLFNTGQPTTATVLASSFDSRSDDKGPEPEGVVIGEVNGRVYAFVTLERVGGVITYDVTEPDTAFFVSYAPPTLTDAGPETLTFIPAAQSPTGTPLIATANEISGTVTLYSIGVGPARRGGAEADTITGTAGPNVIAGLGGDDVLSGLDGNDVLVGGMGNDRLSGGTGANELIGGAGDDVYVITSALDSIVEGPSEGIDTVETALALYILQSGVESLTFTSPTPHLGLGNALDNRITGGNGTDELYGLDGNDVLIGGTGNDLLFGGAGRDAFRYTSRETGIDRIFDFTSGTDRIEFQLAGFAPGAALTLQQGAGPFSANTAAPTLLYDSSDGRLYFDENGSVAGGIFLFAQLNAGLTLSAGDFAFV